jgi:hypothetical protein
MTSFVSGVPPAPLQTALRAIMEANRTVAAVAQDLAENGVENLAENVVTLTTAEIAAKANAIVARTAAELDREVIDILA